MASCLSLYSAPTVIAATKSQRNIRPVMCAKNNPLISFNPQITVKSFRLNNKVYEDREAGIVCYKDDETGDITCEGYDEGPRFHQQHQPSRFTCDHRREDRRDAEIREMLQRCCVHHVDVADEKHELENADKEREMAVKKEV